MKHFMAMGRDVAAAGITGVETGALTPVFSRCYNEPFTVAGPE